MPLTVVRLRRAIVALAVLLLAVIAGALLYGRWRLRHIAQDLPGRLGIQIQQSTQGFVLSQSNGQGRTLFTLRAARAVRFKSGGRVSLHDVEIDLYNPQDSQADTIAGTEFEFDPQTQIVQSPGEARIVLHAPQPQTATAKKNSDQTVKVTTHGLVFNQKTGVATCAGEVDFQTPQSSGRAVGAEYDSKQGKLFLKSQLVLTTTLRNAPATLRASSATYDRNAGRVHLSQPVYSSRAQSGLTAGKANTAIVFLSNSGSVEQLDARGDVQLKSGDRTKVNAAAIHVLMGENNQPKQADFAGGVRFVENEMQQRTSGGAQEAEVVFNGQGHANQIVLYRDVQVQQEIASGGNISHRTLTSNRLLIHLRPARPGSVQLQSAEATGNAIFQSQSTAGGHPQNTKLEAQSLKAKFAAGNQLQQIEGVGNTLLQMSAANGDIDSSTGDTLQIAFTSNRNGGAKPPGYDKQNNSLSTESISTAVQTGHVVLKQISSGKNGDSVATAQRASYASAGDTLTLIGAPVFRDSQMEMSADQMQIERTAGRMIANGMVQTTLRADARTASVPASGYGGLLSAGQPAHIIARRAVLMHGTGRAVFSGRARLWQGDNSIEAPTINLSQKGQTLTAQGDPSCSQCVLGNFASEAAPTPSAISAAAKVGSPSAFRVLSDRLVYSDAERKATLLNQVQVISTDGELLANQAEIYFTLVGARAENRNRPVPKNKIASFDRNNPGQPSVERIVATGNVRLLQPGRRATGARLVYTASNGYFVLTGNGSNPPLVNDVEHGTVTGKTVTFASASQAIIVDGATTTKTRIQKK